MSGERDPGDNTGMAFRHVPGTGKKADDYLFRNPKIVPCGNCGQENRWRVIADDDPKSALMKLQCAACGALSRPWEARKPQMDDHRAKALGLYVPQLTIETEIDIENER